MPATRPTTIGAQTDEFCRLQIAIDALLDFGAEEMKDGPTGADDRYLAFGREWRRFVLSGLSIVGSEPMKVAAADFVDPALTVDDCITGLSAILHQLKVMTPDDFALHRDGILRVNREQRRKNAAKHGEGNVDHFDAKYALRFQEAWGAINAIHDVTPKFAGRYERGDVVVGGADFGTYWAALWNSAMFHMLGGEAGKAAQEVREQMRQAPYPAEETMTAIENFRDRLLTEDEWTRSLLFAAMYQHRN
jgi:hypothetical protein